MLIKSSEAFGEIAFNSVATSSPAAIMGDSVNWWQSITSSTIDKGFGNYMNFKAAYKATGNLESFVMKKYETIMARSASTAINNLASSKNQATFNGYNFNYERPNYMGMYQNGLSNINFMRI